MGGETDRLAHSFLSLFGTQQNALQRVAEMTNMATLTDNNPHDRDLLEQVHPHGWKNPIPSQPYHLVVIGAGTAGLVTAAAAAGLGARVALIERDLMGGDCLNTGCVPSKGLISTARMAAHVRDAGPFGVKVAGEASVDFAFAMDRMRSKRAQISPADSAKRFQSLGVDVYFGQAKFVDQHTIVVTSEDQADQKIPFRKAVIATGARAAAPPIPGLDSVAYLTNENLFSLKELPKRFGIVGSGPIGCEMAQSFARFGSQVFLFEMAEHILPREDPAASALLQKQFNRDKITTITDSKNMVLKAQPNGAIRISGNQASEPYAWEVDQLLIAVGRTPNVDGLGLDTVGVEFDRQGVKVNDHLQTTNSRIYAAGDIASAFKFTHAADFQARIVIQNALFALGPFGRKKTSDLIIPAATYTSPEIAHVGLYEKDATQSGIAFDTYLQPFEHLDRAILEDHEGGFVKVLTKQGTDQILGATIVAENAGDLISEIVVAMTNGIGLSGIGASIHPYPTVAESIRKLGDQYGRTRLTPFSQKLLNLLRRFNVGK